MASERCAGDTASASGAGSGSVDSGVAAASAGGSLTGFDAIGTFAAMRRSGIGFAAGNGLVAASGGAARTGIGEVGAVCTRTTSNTVRGTGDGSSENAGNATMTAACTAALAARNPANTSGVRFLISPSGAGSLTIYLGNGEFRPTEPLYGK